MDFMKSLKSKNEISTDRTKNIKVEEIPILQITPDKNQVRKSFDDNTLEDLSASIKQNGIQNPIHVIKNNNNYIILTGERRYRASKIAKIEILPCIVHKEGMSIKEIKTLQLIENLQREDLTGLETAQGFLSLKETGVSQIQVSRELGVSEGYVSKGLKILKILPSEWIKEIQQERPKASIYEIYNGIAKIKDKKKREIAYKEFIGEETENDEEKDIEEAEITMKESISFSEEDYLDAWERIKLIVKRDKSRLSQFITNKKLQGLIDDYRE